MDKILTDIEFRLDDFNPKAIADKIAKNFKKRRLELNITQKELSEKAGVSFGSVKRFENKSAVSLKHLLLMAVVLNSTNEFLNLFTRKQYLSIDEISREAAVKQRKRARKSDK